MAHDRRTTVQVVGDVPTRIFAAMVDLLVVSFVIFVVAIPIGLVLGPAVRVDPTADRTADLLEIDRAVAAVDAVAALVVSAGYFVTLWSRAGKTLGLRWFALRVGDLSGRNLGLGRAAARWAVTWGPISVLGLLNAVGVPGGLLLGLVALGAAWYCGLVVLTSRNADRRGPHDRIAGSVVTKRSVLIAGASDVEGRPDVG